MNFNLGSVVIDNFDFTCFTFLPNEAKAPLSVDADAVLTGSIAFESFEMVGRRRPQVLQNFSTVDLKQFAEGDALDVSRQPTRSFAFPNLLRFVAAEAMDHRNKV
jgi:hypothetical protein